MVWKYVLVVPCFPVAYGMAVIYGLEPWISMIGPVFLEITLWI